LSWRPRRLPAVKLVAVCSSNTLVANRSEYMQNTRCHVKDNQCVRGYRHVNVNEARCGDSGLQCGQRFSRSRTTPPDQDTDHTPEPVFIVKSESSKRRYLHICKGPRITGGADDDHGTLNDRASAFRIQIYLSARSDINNDKHRIQPLQWNTVLTRRPLQIPIPMHQYHTYRSHLHHAVVCQSVPHSHSGPSQWSIPTSTRTQAPSPIRSRLPLIRTVRYCPLPQHGLLQDTTDVRGEMPADTHWQMTK
jgi:hypothetical protein